MSSSSSSSYCVHPECVGQPCANFQNWYVEGIDATEVTNDTISVRFNVFGSIQQVELYKDPSYFFLIGIGQRDFGLEGAGPIVFSERNNSKVSGSVDWDGTFTNFSQTATLYCKELSSSSSSSSLDSSSTSSESISSESSETSFCCTEPYCSGGPLCVYFSNWSFSGFYQLNSDDCRLYVGFESDQPSIQQVRIYNDSFFSNLVAIGQISGSGTIVLNEINNSGLSGSVDWDGTLVDYPNYLILDCNPFSSSSTSESSSIDSSSSSSVDSFSSSSSSVDSSSSSSSSSFLYSESSFSSESSLSSTSLSSSSSSSSIDSSSESSESLNNFSSSSSSSIEIWNRGKPLVLGNSAINSLTVQNRIAQTLTFSQNSYDIGKVYCYLGSQRKDNSVFQINLGIYTCNDSGEPMGLLKMDSLSIDDIDTTDWYSFEFNIVGTMPSNKYLSFVMWQDGGDEDNYVMWFYNKIDFSSSSEVLDLALISNDNVNWERDFNVLRSLNVVNSFNPYDLEEGTVNSSPATLKVIDLVLNKRNPIYDKTSLNQEGHVELEYSPIAISFIVDNSGSMGWNDRFLNRKSLIEGIVERLSSKYPNEVVYDVISFGSKVAKTSSVTENLGSVDTINLDLNSPSRKTYTFNSSSSSNVVEGSIYAHNGFEYTVLNSADNVSTISLLGTGSPLSSGTLALTSGGGDPIISFSDFSTFSLESSIVAAVGFKNLKENRTYNVGDISVDNQIVFSSANSKNWNLYHPSDESPSLVNGNNGPLDSSSIDINSTFGTIVRRNWTNADLSRTLIVEKINVNDSSVLVDDASVFSVENNSFNSPLVDFVSGDVMSAPHSIVDFDEESNIISFSPEANISIPNQINFQGFVETGSGNYGSTIDGTTLQILVRDLGFQFGEFITLFFQDRNGNIMEWDFNPFPEWTYGNVFYLNETAILPISIFEEDGTPFPDGTKVVLEVDLSRKSEVLRESDILFDEKILLIEDSLKGKFNAFVSSAEGFKKDDSIILRNRKFSQELTIDSITEINKSRTEIVFTKAIEYDFLVVDASYILKSGSLGDEVFQGKPLGLELYLVDATPVESGESLDPSLLRPYDVTPIPPSNDPNDKDEKLEIYDQINLQKDVMRRGSIDIPSINGLAAVRFLPITEDILTDLNTKNKRSEGILFSGPPTLFSSQIERNSGDFESLEKPEAIGQEDEEETKDYIIESPIYLRKGEARSYMSTTSNDIEAIELEGIYNIPGVPSDVQLQQEVNYGVQYSVTPYIEESNDQGAVTAIQFFEDVNVNFISPVQIYSFSEGISKNISFFCECKFNECGKPLGYDELKMRGIYSVDNDPIVIDYVVTNKRVLIKQGTLRIKIYSSTTLNQEGWASAYEDEMRQTKQYLNVKPFPEIQINEDGSQEQVQKVSDIDVWRSEVSSNSASEYVNVSANLSSEIDGAVNEAISNIGLTEEQERSVENDIRIKLASQFVEQYNAIIQENQDKIDQILGFSEDEEEEKSYNFYSESKLWTLANQYETSTLEIPIVNGRAQLIIPPHHEEATLFVEASYDIAGGIYEAIRSDLFFVRNPLMISGLTPYNTTVANEDSKYELGGLVTWRDGKDGVIEDNVTVNFLIPRTEANPTVSVTDDGWAGGVFLGPRPVLTYLPKLDDVCPPRPLDEVIKVTITHPDNYSIEYYRVIHWDFVILEDQNFNFLFKIEGSISSSWSDGNEVNPSIIKSDLYDGFNQFILGASDSLRYWIGESGVRSLNFGEGQNPPVPRVVLTSSDRALNKRSNWGRGSVEFQFKNINQNIGNKSLIDPVGSPWEEEVSIITSYRDENEKLIVGSGAFGPPIPVGEELVVPRPKLRHKEPLEINMSIEKELVRDGLTQAVIVAEVLWRGEPITNYFIFNEGLESEERRLFPFPFVTFKAGIADENVKNPFNVTASGDELTQDYIDNRGSLGCILDVESHPDAKLTDTYLSASLSRTGIFESDEGFGFHTHACEVDSDGNGNTTSTISFPDENGNIIEVPDHTHVISNYQSDVKTIDGINEEHSHGLRCVAVTEFLPTSNQRTVFHVIGIAEYDPTNCSPYTGLRAGVGGSYPINGNRMMFTSLEFGISEESEEDEQKPELILELSGSTGENLSTDFNILGLESGSKLQMIINAAENPYETIQGLTLKVKASIKDSNGIRDIPDGTRVGFEFDTFIPSEDSQGVLQSEAERRSIVVTGPNIQRKYMAIVGRVFLFFEGIFIYKDFEVSVVSDLEWIPGIKSLLLDPSSEPEYINQAIQEDKFNFIGGSQIYDAMQLASKRMIKAQSLDLDLKDYPKAFFVLTDGDENSSEISLTQAINSIYFVSQGESPIIPLQLGYVYPGDEILLKKMALESNGYGFNMVDIVDLNRIKQNLVDEIFLNENWIIGQGKYINDAELPKESIGYSLKLKNSIVPEDSELEFRYRISLDRFNWSDWSEWNGYDETVFFDQNFDDLFKYIEYEVKFKGSNIFNSPVMLSDLSIDYFSQSPLAIFFNASPSIDSRPSEEKEKGGFNNSSDAIDSNANYISSVHITHEANIPETSKIEYGITQNNSQEIYSDVRSDEHTILLTRYNEPLEAVDFNFRDYYALNGKWPNEADVSIYKVNQQHPDGILVDKSEYGANSSLGVISFISSQNGDDQFLINIGVNPSFKIICNIINYGERSASIEHIGIVYNIMKRIPVDEEGNIIRKPINLRIK